MISHLLLTEPAPLAANQDDSTNDSSLRTLLTLCDLLNRELLVLISWAKQIPGKYSNHLVGEEPSYPFDKTVIRCSDLIYSGFV